MAQVYSAASMHLCYDGAAFTDPLSTNWFQSSPPGIRRRSLWASLTELSMRRSFHYPAGIKAVGSRHTLAFSCVFVINFPGTLISEKAHERERERVQGSGGKIDFAQGEGGYRLWHIKGYLRLWIEEGTEAFTIKKVLCGLCVSSVGRRASQDDGKKAVSGSSMITLAHSPSLGALALWSSATMQHFAHPQRKSSAFYNPKQKGWQRKGKHSESEWPRAWTVLNDQRCHIVTQRRSFVPRLFKCSLVSVPLERSYFPCTLMKTLMLR